MTTEKKLLTRIQQKGCSGAQVIQNSAPSTALTPIMTPGDTALLRIKLPQSTSLSVEKLPDAWVVAEPLKGLAAGTHYLSVRTPKAAAKKEYSISFLDSEEESYHFKIELVSRVKG